MDFATIGGLIIGFAALIVGFLLEGRRDRCPVVSYGIHHCNRRIPSEQLWFPSLWKN